MPWSTAISVGGSLLGGMMSGKGGKKAANAARDAAVNAQLAQEQARRQVFNAVSPYMDSGENANRLLSQYLGTAEPEGYAKKPNLQDFENQVRDEHFRWARKDYGGGSNIAGQTAIAKKRYEDAKIGRAHV